MAAKRVFASGWQEPQVCVRFAGLTVERGSAVRKMLCTPWHEAQFATERSPRLVARPW